MMQDRCPPPSPPEVKDLDSDVEIMESDVEEVIDMDDSIFESSSENEDTPTEDHRQKDDAACVFRGHVIGFTVFCCSLSKSGELAATGDENDRAYLWNTHTGESIFNTGTSHDDSIVFAEFNHSDKYLATADMRGKIQLWKIKDKTCVWETSLGTDISWMKWHHSANILIAGIVSGEVYMFKTQKDNFKIFAQGIGDKTETGIIFPDGKHMAVGYESGKIQVLNLQSNAVVSTTPADQTRSRGHASGVIGLDCHMDNNLIISISLQAQTILSTAHNGKVVCILQDLSRTESDGDINVETVAFCKDPAFSAAATGAINSNLGGKLYIWDISKQTLRHEIDQEGGIVKLVWTQTSMLLTAALDGKLRCFDAKAGYCLRTFSGHNAALYDLCISSDGKKALTTSDDSTARIFDISAVC
ncbi:PREDICTED: angio-associated migratory cell protein [Vollenhovia emeryi]|uniref:angio-associated migratory cell protein n=1 Tax=Vollenhovia emeryi TaxID=411798 RepID=UPI0005F43C0F|nr:PREDICTED: angio-associated migratory cell protein [Vollenhovia emeryi]